MGGWAEQSCKCCALRRDSRPYRMGPLPCSSNSRLTAPARRVANHLFDNGGISPVNQTGFEFLLLDLDLAMTFLDVAKASKNEETIRRNKNNARRACHSVLNPLEKLTPDAEQRQVINAELAFLKT
jgi:hypothetical protein